MNWYENSCGRAQQCYLLRSQRMLGRLWFALEIHAVVVAGASGSKLRASLCWTQAVYTKWTRRQQNDDDAELSAITYESNGLMSYRRDINLLNNKTLTYTSKYVKSRSLFWARWIGIFKCVLTTTAICFFCLFLSARVSVASSDKLPDFTSLHLHYFIVK